MGAGVANATVTSRSGSAAVITALPIRNIYYIEWDVIQKVIQFYYKDSFGNPQYAEIDYAFNTTFTVTISGDTSTIVLS